MSIRPLDQLKCPLDIQMSIFPLDQLKCSIRPLDISVGPSDKWTFECPMDISVGPLDEWTFECPMDISVRPMDEWTFLYIQWTGNIYNAKEGAKT